MIFTSFAFNLDGFSYKRGRGHPEDGGHQGSDGGGETGKCRAEV